MTPFAYISDQGVLFKELPPSPWFNLTPLYKMRELTDIEILEVANQIEPLNGSTMEQAFIYFARAVLKKAGEK
jgi:hypothetical protein